MKLWSAPIVAFLLAVLLAGCGGGDEEGSAATVPVPETIPVTKAGLTKTELISKIAPVCAKVDFYLRRLPKEFLVHSEETDEEARLYAFLGYEVEDLGAPEEAEGYPELYAAMDHLSDTADQVDIAFEIALEEENSPKSEAKFAAWKEKAASALESFQATAEEYGLKGCSDFSGKGFT